MTGRDIYLASDIKSMDESCGISSELLMENAALALFRRLEMLGRLKGNICIICGKGNNGGDGYALAVSLLKAKIGVTVFSVDSPSSPLAVKFKKAYEDLGGEICRDIKEAINAADTVVDCIFGFSFRGTLEGANADAVRTINDCSAFVLAVDVPSGLTADDTRLPPLAVKADCTCTFTALKPALASYPAARLCGKIYIEDIGIPEEVIKRHAPFAAIADERLLALLPERRADGHKGTFGTLAALCGNAETCGAAYLACLSALKSGVGMVRLYTDVPCATVTKARIAEPIISDNCTAKAILSQRHDALLIGCGCGRTHDDTIKKLLLEAKASIVLDADGINCIAGDIELYRSVNPETVITPHPAEMGRLVGKSAEEINSLRVESAVEFAKKYGFVTVLKGAKTVIAAPDGRLCISLTENTGLAKGGSGDVLAGLIASLLAQGMNSFDAACLGVYLHGAAAERLASKKGVYAMLPSELPEIIGQIMYFG